MEDKTVYQINDESHVVSSYSSVKEISELFRVNRASFDQALRDGFKSHGFFWIFKIDWENGVRPDFTKQIRNTEVYAYNPYRKILGGSGNGRVLNEFDHSKFLLIGRYKNAVHCAKDLNISVSNIRLVCKGEKELHMGYWFSYIPLKPEDDFLGDLKEAFERDLEVRTKYGKGQINELTLFPVLKTKFTVFENENKEEQVFKFSDLAGIRDFIIKVIDPLKKLHSRSEIETIKILK